MARQGIGYQPQPVAWRGVRAKEFEVSGFVGMYDSKAKGGEQSGQAPILINLLPSDTTRPSQVVLRSGLTRIGPSTTLRVGSGTARTVQWIGLGVQFLGDGVIIRKPLVWCGGELYEVNVTTPTVTKVLSTAQLAAASPTIVISATLPIGAAVFNGKIVFAQKGVRPFMWDGTTGAGLTSLTNAPINFESSADPAVYYGKLFFMSTDVEIQWSEENQPNVGYTASGFNNAWQLTTTGTSRLVCLIGTNEGLFYGRDGAIGIIRGAVSTTFTTDGVRESISPNSGPSVVSGSLLPMLWADNTLFWFDGTNRPWAWRAGQGVVPLWKTSPRQFGQNDASAADDLVTLFQVGEQGLAGARLMSISHDAVQGIVSFNGRSNRDAGSRVALLFDVASLSPLCWETWTVANKPNQTCPRFAQQGSLGPTAPQLHGELYVDENGYAFVRALSDPGFLAPQYRDHSELASNDVDVLGTIVGPMHGWTAQQFDWRFDQVSVVVASTTNSSVSAAVLTSRQPTSTLSPFQNLSDSGPNVPSERAVTFGLNRSGRWGRVVAQIKAVTNDNDRPAIFGWRLRAYPQGAAPSMP